MPMSWTPENDRLLLLKLIETHGITVDSHKIVAAWPDGPVKPSARAITERFVKLRQLVGIKSSMPSGGATGKARARTSKFTTPRKRKIKADISDESDANGHLTENESPTKKQSIRRGAGGRGRGSTQKANSPAICIKSEHPPPQLPIDPLDTYDNFELHAAQATELQQSSQENPFAKFSSSGVNGNFQSFDPSNGHPALTGFEMGNGTAFDNGFANPSLPLDDPFTGPRHSTHGFTNSIPAILPSQANGLVDTSSSRNRSARKASVQASEGVAAFLRRQKDEDEADGEKSSGEGSQASEYHDLDGDFV